MTWLATGIDSAIMNCNVRHMLWEAGLKFGDKVDCFCSIIPSITKKRGIHHFQWKMIFGPSSRQIASLKSRYIKATCRNKHCSEFTGSSIGVVGGIKHLVTTEVKYDGAIRAGKRLWVFDNVNFQQRVRHEHQGNQTIKK